MEGSDFRLLLPIRKLGFPKRAPAFSVANAQITRTFSSVFEMYAGGENIGDYRQENAIRGNETRLEIHSTHRLFTHLFMGVCFMRDCGLNLKIKNQHYEKYHFNTDSNDNRIGIGPGKKDKNASAEIGVSGNCEQCKKRIEKAAYSVKGVKSAQWHNDDQMLHLILNEEKATVADVRKAVAKAGHDTDSLKASDTDYSSLHSCCKYERKQ